MSRSDRSLIERLIGDTLENGTVMLMPWYLIKLRGRS